MFNHEDFDKINSEVRNLSIENSDFKNFNSMSLSIAELIYLSSFDNEEDRYKFMLSLLNIFFFNTKSNDITIDDICDIVLALGMHIAISIQCNDNEVEYKDFLNNEIVPSIHKELSKE